jgi:hypothetical protein
MGSTLPSAAQSVHDDREESVSIQWRSWPLVEYRRWSWLVIMGILAVAGLIVSIGANRLLATLVAIGLAVTLWQFFMPIDYEIGRQGLRRTVLGRTQLLPWHSIRAYQPRTIGVVLYRRHDPTNIDLLRSLFVPYPDNRAEALSVLRVQLSHATELPA